MGRAGALSSAQRPPVPACVPAPRHQCSSCLRQLGQRHRHHEPRPCRLRAGHCLCLRRDHFCRVLGLVHGHHCWPSCHRLRFPSSSSSCRQCPCHWCSDRCGLGRQHSFRQSPCPSACSPSTAGSLPCPASRGRRRPSPMSWSLVFFAASAASRVARSCEATRRAARSLRAVAISLRSQFAFTVINTDPLWLVLIRSHPFSCILILSHPFSNVLSALCCWFARVHQARTNCSA